MVSYIISWSIQCKHHSFLPFISGTFLLLLHFFSFICDIYNILNSLFLSYVTRYTFCYLKSSSITPNMYVSHYYSCCNPHICLSLIPYLLILYWPFYCLVPGTTKRNDWFSLINKWHFSKNLRLILQKVMRNRTNCYNLQFLGNSIMNNDIFI